MKILSLRISNVLSFQFRKGILQSEELVFDDNLNIIIGENGAGKSTVLEIINFLLKKVLFSHTNIDRETYENRDSLPRLKLKNVLKVIAPNDLGGFRLAPNRKYRDRTQSIELIIKLDEIDKTNIANLIKNKDKLSEVSGLYSNFRAIPNHNVLDEFTISITLDQASGVFNYLSLKNEEDFGYQYLKYYQVYKDLIEIYNDSAPGKEIEILYEPFSIISGYRNYDRFESTINLSAESAAIQLDGIKINDLSRSLNTNVTSEPSIFRLVRLRLADIHFSMAENVTLENTLRIANEELFLAKINQKLGIVNIKVEIRLENRKLWTYAFEFYDIRTGELINDINSLSSGQKAIIHLVFEAYGRGDVKGGVIIIDEPEIHLHHQFQNEYLRILKEINLEQKCQYIIVTHSESFINYETINSVKRLALNNEGETIIKSPNITTEGKHLIKILDNTGSVKALFGNKIILVEGDSDRYFYKCLIDGLSKVSQNNITVLDVKGKGNLKKWRKFFEDFGLKVYIISDLDSAREYLYPGSKEAHFKLNTPQNIKQFKDLHKDIETEILEKRKENIFILKYGALEQYLRIEKEMEEVIDFCDNKLQAFLVNKTSPENIELIEIFNLIISD